MKFTFKDLLRQVQNYPKWATDEEFNVNMLGEVESWCKHTLFLTVQTVNELRERREKTLEKSRGFIEPYVLIRDLLGDDE